MGVVHFCLDLYFMKPPTLFYCTLGCYFVKRGLFVLMSCTHQHRLVLEPQEKIFRNKGSNSEIKPTIKTQNSAPRSKAFSKSTGNLWSRKPDSIIIACPFQVLPDWARQIKLRHLVYLHLLNPCDKISSLRMVVYSDKLISSELN